MKKVQSGQGYTDLGTEDEKVGVDRMGRGVEIITTSDMPGMPTVVQNPVTGEERADWSDYKPAGVYPEDHYPGPQLVDKPVLQGVSDRKVTFTGQAAEEYRAVKQSGWNDEDAFRHAEVVQKLIDGSREAGIQNDGDSPDLGRVIEAKREEILAADPSLVDMFGPPAVRATDVIAAHLTCDCGGLEDLGENAEHIERELFKAGFVVVRRG